MSDGGLIPRDVIFARVLPIPGMVQIRPGRWIDTRMGVGISVERMHMGGYLEVDEKMNLREGESNWVWVVTLTYCIGGYAYPYRIACATEDDAHLQARDLAEIVNKGIQT